MLIGCHYVNELFVHTCNLGDEKLTDISSSGQSKEPDNKFSNEPSDMLYPKHRVLSKPLEASYRDTNYCVPSADRLIILRVDEPSEDIQRLIANANANANADVDVGSNVDAMSAVFMTAHNPFSEFVSDEANGQANTILQQQLELNYENVLPCYGESLDQEYREESFLVFPIARAEAIELCIQYDQYAVLFIERDAVPRLVFHPDVLVESQT